MVSEHNSDGAMMTQQRMTSEREMSSVFTRTKVCMKTVFRKLKLISKVQPLKVYTGFSLTRPNILRGRSEYPTADWYGKS